MTAYQARILKGHSMFINETLGRDLWKFQKAKPGGSVYKTNTLNRCHESTP